ncbi:FecR family protein [Petrimonas sp.]|uniref:FecR family protein n=1 Tax=Petrimonas sp. TaxID=2023866 RepID=UPI003F517B35
MDKLPTSVFDFFNDEKFIEWRLNTDEFDSYWDQFTKDNPRLKSHLDEAVRKFDSVKINDYSLSSETEKTMYNELLARIKKHRWQKKRKILTYSLSAAASIALLILSATFLLTQNRDVAVVQDIVVGKTQPSSDIQLITGEKTVTLGQNADITVSEQGSASITDSTRQQETLELSRKETNRLIIPYGKRSFLILSDGTKVWLNSGTEMEFPTAFDEKSRTVHIKGEVYIEVAQVANKPFVVKTPEMDVKVLGTAFNLSAYAGSKNESVVLVEGSVQVNTRGNKEVKLAPNELLTVSGENTEVKSVDVSEYISWRKGVLEFKKTPISEVLEKIGRYYNVEFENNADVTLKGQTISGKLFLSSNLDSVMTSVSVLSSTVYSREGQIIQIKKSD